MNRRQFLQSGAAGLTAARFGAFADTKPRRVGVIGPGWYGKCDVFRLIQVAPVEVVSICDVDSRMADQAADLIAGRQASKKRPRIFSDYREMLRQKDLDIVTIATPDHWHALTMIDAVKAGADVWVQKPISVDVAEGRAMLAAARKYGRVVQVGTQRRSTPHLVEARDRIIGEGKLGHIAQVDICCHIPMRSSGNPPAETPPPNLNYEMWTGPAPMRPYTKLTHPGSWRAFMEYGNGIVGDMAIHMFDMVRWMMNLGWPTRISSSGGILVDKSSISNISDTQIATFDYPDVKIVWSHRTYGAPADKDYPWGATFYGDKGTLKASVFRYDFIPRQGEPIHKDVTYELEQYPEDKTEARLERHCAPAIRAQMRNFLASIDARSRPVADIEEGYISTSSCILANHAMTLGRTLAWDPVKHQVIGDSEANRLLTRPYRAPWLHPDAATV